MNPQVPDGLRKALTLVLRYLALKGRTQREIEEYLKQKGFGGSIVDAVVERLKEWGYLDDRKVIMEWARGKMERSLWGPLRLRAEMRRRGLEEELVSELVAELFEEVKERELAQKAAERYLRTHRKGKVTTVAKLGAHLARKGFSGAVIREVLSRGAFITSCRWGSSGKEEAQSN